MTTMRLMLVAVRQDPIKPYQPEGGYWWLNITNEQTGAMETINISHRKAAALLAMGVPEVK